MKITNSYGIEIKQMNKIFRPTIAIYNNAISFCVECFENEWNSIVSLDTIQRNNLLKILYIIQKIIKQNMILMIDFTKCQAICVEVSSIRH